VRPSRLSLCSLHHDHALTCSTSCRRLCGKLYLKGETQQVDRILEQFSRRYFDDNLKIVYGSPGASTPLAASSRARARQR